ncbi:uncharacterized protein B0I36DRAFT_323711 [Microdochium trichocladiopsis]|uniref:Myb-like domain-containing protein n=1 Tax=Microdochium trichocladiopsis TaxID=1682393 RepID=A0A9P9BQW7_9PEZI|nr:uncharacterized protein B0I36DRAFT_323711 [Microdochium trichocladiopsis]KAH7031337.1 hypothetical protein B0I36DRAFT_323711 [Microdochium trichocladiopsis]
MLMPSALSCDSSQAPVTRLQASLFASPPASPPAASHNAFGNIFSSCRALQSMLTAPSPSPSSSTFSQMPTPPLAHAALPEPTPMKLRLRARKSDNEAAPRKKITKRSAPPRGRNKRRRGLDDDMGRDDVDSELELEQSESEQEEEAGPAQPTTPKRARLAPEIIPLGLERSDFHNLHALQGFTDIVSGQSADAEVEADGESWTLEDDRILVELILEKLKLSKSDWQDCARSLGKDRSSLGRRWKTLVNAGDVGLKNTRSRRNKIHATWR